MSENPRSCLLSVWGGGVDRGAELPVFPGMVKSKPSNVGIIIMAKKNQMSGPFLENDGLVGKKTAFCQPIVQNTDILKEACPSLHGPAVCPWKELWRDLVPTPQKQTTPTRPENDNNKRTQNDDHHGGRGGIPRFREGLRLRFTRRLSEVVHTLRTAGFVSEYLSRDHRQGELYKGSRRLWRGRGPGGDNDDDDDFDVIRMIERGYNLEVIRTLQILDVHFMFRFFGDRWPGCVFPPCLVFVSPIQYPRHPLHPAPLSHAHTLTHPPPDS